MTPVPGGLGFVYDHRHDGTRVITALETADAPDGTHEPIDQWHVSISRQARRPDDEAVERALKAFDMVGAEEDNHHPGIARHFWMPCDPVRRVECECKSTEDVIVERDGYMWTNPKPETGETCRGCDLEKEMGSPCPIHKPSFGPRARRSGRTLVLAATLALLGVGEKGGRSG